MKDVKIIANYLPQYYEIEENNKFWGKGYTDWVAVKKVKPVINGQTQPRIPLNQHYYKLDDPVEIRWQANLAKNYGIYGFGIYHYWFSTDNYLLEKPAEIILQDKSIDINFMFLWDNSTWKRSWSNIKNANDWAPNFDSGFQNDKYKNGILKELIYGDKKDWEYHFNYLLPFFKDERYIKKDGKVMFGFFQPQNDIVTIQRMIKFWDSLAIKNGLHGIYAMVRDDRHNFNVDKKFKYTPFVPCTKINYSKFKIKQVLCEKLDRPKVFDYDKCWKEILKEAKKADPKTFLSGFVMYDDTPRRGMKAKIVKKSTPDKFQKYLEQLVKISLNQGKEYLFLTAWNEWGEGAYLEPDVEYEYAYLHAVKKVISGNE